MVENLQSVENTLSLYNYEECYQIVIYNLCFYYDCKMKIFSRAKSFVVVLVIVFLASCGEMNKPAAVEHYEIVLEQCEKVIKGDNFFFYTIARGNIDEVIEIRKNNIIEADKAISIISQQEGVDGDSSIKLAGKEFVIKSKKALEVDYQLIIVSLQKIKSNYEQDSAYKSWPEIEKVEKLIQKTSQESQKSVERFRQEAREYAQRHGITIKSHQQQ